MAKVSILGDVERLFPEGFRIEEEKQFGTEKPVGSLAEIWEKYFGTDKPFGRDDGLLEGFESMFGSIFDPPEGWRTAPPQPVAPPRVVPRRVFEALQTGELCSLESVQNGLWAFRGKVVLIENADHLPAEEQQLEIKHAVLKHEQRYERLRRQVDAYSRFEKTESARRERIPDEVKRFVFERDEGKCVKCGSTRNLEFDHIIPVSKGGSNTERNIQLLCERCNREKGDRI